MNIGIIGAGRVGTSLGKYFTDHNVSVVGFYDISEQAAKEAAKFAQTDSFLELLELVLRSDTLFITSPDGVIEKVWDRIRLMSIESKIICHCSGSLSSVVFSGVEEAKAFACSIHPLLAFSDKFLSYSQLNHAYFSIEGMGEAVSVMKPFMESLGNHVCEIDSSSKAKYHAAASVLSNQVVAVLDTGYKLLTECGFDEAFAVEATKSLVLGNVSHVVEDGCVKALTGPIDRNDVGTVQKHLACLSGEDLTMYKVLGTKLARIAKQKNPNQDYKEMESLLK